MRTLPSGPARDRSRRRIALGEELAPRPVDEDHQLGDQLVERRAALAHADRHAAVLDVEAVLDRARAGARLAAPRLERQGDPPGTRARRRERTPGRRALARDVVEDVDFVVAQVRGDRHQLDARLLAADREPTNPTSRYSDTAGRSPPSSSENRSITVGGQHRELVAGHVGGRQPLARDRVDRRAGREAERRRGDVHAHAHRPPPGARPRTRRRSRWSPRRRG